MSRAFLLALLLSLPACGRTDPTPDPDDAAGAGEVNAAVDRAEAQMEAAQEKTE